MTINLHPISHPLGTPQISTKLDFGHASEGVFLVQVGILISHPKQIRFESDSKLV